MFSPSPPRPDAFRPVPPPRWGVHPVEGVAIRTMRPRHLRGVVAVERASSARPWSERLFLGELERPDLASYFVALSGAAVIGFAGAMVVGDEAHVTNVAVDPRRRRHGVGRALVDALLRDCARRGAVDATLEVRVGNTAAKELYRSFGFAPGGLRPGYYQDNGEDALIMWSHGFAARLTSGRENAGTENAGTENAGPVGRSEEEVEGGPDDAGE